MKFPATVLFFLMIIASACGTAGKAVKSSMVSERIIPIAIKIESNNDVDLHTVNMDYYRLRVLAKLEDFQSVKFILVDVDQNPEITLNLNIDNFMLSPLDKSVSNQVFSASVQSGTNTAGRPVYETVSASVDHVKVEQRSNARMLVDLQVKGTPGMIFKQSFAPRYKYAVRYAENLQGDFRAVKGSFSSKQGPVEEPNNTDFLLNLSGEMLVRVSTEIRSYYRK